MPAHDQTGSFPAVGSERSSRTCGANSTTAAQRLGLFAGYRQQWQLLPPSRIARPVQVQSPMEERHQEVCALFSTVPHRFLPVTHCPGSLLQPGLHRFCGWCSAAWEEVSCLWSVTHQRGVERNQRWVLVSGVLTDRVGAELYRWLF